MYTPLSLHPETPPNLRQAINNSLELLLRDVRALLQLPKPERGFHAGGNYLAIIGLCSVIAASSRFLYPRKFGDGKAFKKLLSDRFPWDFEPSVGLRGEEAAEVLYKVFRNSLVHSAGLAIEQRGQGGNKTYVIKPPTLQPKVKKYNGLSDKTLRGYESSLERPGFSATLIRRESEQVMVVLVEGLYWGVRRMITDLVDDPEIRTASNTMLIDGLSQNQTSRAPVPLPGTPGPIDHTVASSSVQQYSGFDAPFLRARS